MAGSGHVQPACVIAQLLSRPLREETVRDPQRQMPIFFELIHNRVIVWIVLPSAASIGDAGYSKSIQLAHKVLEEFNWSS